MVVAKHLSIIFRMEKNEVVACCENTERVLRLLESCKLPTLGRWGTQGAQLAVRLRYPDPFDRFRSVVLLLQPFRQFPKPAFFSRRFDVFKTHSIYPGCSLVGFAASVGMVEHVPSMNLVVQEVEPVPGFFLRFGM